MLVRSLVRVSTVLVLALAARLGAEEVSFASDLLPLLQDRCFKCHSGQAARPKAGLRLDDPKLLMAGSKNGPVVVPGKADGSELYRRISLPHDDEDLMPPPGRARPLSGAEVKRFAEWINAGADMSGWSGAAHAVPVLGVPQAGAAPDADDSSIGPRTTTAPRLPAKDRSAVSPPNPDEDPSAVIERMLEERLAAIPAPGRSGLAAGRQPNPAAADEVFCRRAYLDIVGRIPTCDELAAFCADREPTKRAQLVQQLLDSEGHVLHGASWWADLLRARSGKRQMRSEYYLEYITRSLRENKPYDRWVREMVTADGYLWGDGSTFYYHRDEGMPLDHTATEVQVFLGTQMVCAQCHNHPSDVWTQADYYQMSAYTYGVEALGYAAPQQQALRGLMGGRGGMGAGGQPGEGGERRRRRAERAGAVPAELGDMAEKLRGMSMEERQQLRQGTRDVLFLLQRRVHRTDRQLEYGDDYRYDDALKGTTVAPRTPFGDEAPVAAGEDAVAAWASWMTSPRNPRFTTVIVNRLWKRTFGRGLIEPADDLRHDTVATHPELLEYLELLLIRLGYDLRAFERVLFQTQTYGRESAMLPEESSEPYLFQGPVLRRMTAEQIWDSVMTLMVPDLDSRVGRTYQDLELRRKNLAALETMTVEELLEAGADAGAARTGLLAKRQEGEGLRKELKEAQMAGDEELIADLQEELRELGREARQMRKEGFDPESWRFPLPDDEAGMGMDGGDRRRGGRGGAAMRGFVRAAQLPSPAPPGHFLREFGQSDRELIDNSLASASIPQALMLMNGPYATLVLQQGSPLVQGLREARGPEQRVQALFLSILGREPAVEELAAMVELGRQAEEEAQAEPAGEEADDGFRRRDRGGPGGGGRGMRGMRGMREGRVAQAYQGLQDVVWALLNSREFMFVR